MSTKMREMSDEKQGSTARANFKKLSYTWKQSEDELIMVFDQEGLTPNQKDLDISFGDQYVLIKFPDGKQTWSLIFAKNIDRENTKVQWKKKKLHITMKKKCPQIWSSLERVLKKLQSEPSSEDISEAKKTDLSSVSSTEVMTSGQASGDTPSPDQMSTSEATGDDSGQGDTQTSDEYCVDKDKEEEPVYQLEHVKNSFLEKDDTMTVQIYVKEVKKDTVEVNMTDQTFSVKFSTMNPQFLNLHKDTTSDTIFNWEVKLKHEIVPEKCRYKLTPSVLEITLSKEVSRRWGALEAPQRKETAPAPKSDEWLPTTSSSSSSENKSSSAKPKIVQFDELEDPVITKKQERDEDNRAMADSMKGATGTSASSQKPTCKVSPLNKNMDLEQNVRSGFTGLDNLGNTCFMNSVLQCLSNTREFRDYFLSSKFQDDINTDNPLGFGGKLAISFATLLKVLWAGTHYSYAPSKLKYLISMKASQFTGFAQHDAQEFMAFLLDGLHEDLNRVRKKPYTGTVDSDGRPDHVVADEAWEVYKKRNNSFIVDLFQGQYKSKLVCPVCGKVSITFDPFLYLQVPLPKKKRLIPVIFMWKDPYKKPVQLILRLPKESTTQMLKDAVYKKTGVSPRNMRVFESYKSKFYKFFQNGDDLSSIQANDTIIVSEVLSAEVAGENVYEVYILQRTVLPSQLPNRCASCRSLCPEGSKLKRCMKCYKAGYCDQQCQKNHWPLHKMHCKQSPEPVGFPFVISISESRATFSRICKLMEAYARYSVEIFQPPVKTDSRMSCQPSPSNLSNSSQSSGSMSSLDSQSSCSSSCTITADQEHVGEGEADIGEISSSGSSLVANVGSGLDVTDTGSANRSATNIPSCIVNSDLQLSDDADDESEERNLPEYTSFKLPVDDNAQDNVISLDPPVETDKPKVIPTKPVLGIQSMEAERQSQLFYVKPVNQEGVSLKGPDGERIEDKGDVPIDLTYRQFLSMDWKNNDKLDSYVLVQTKEIDYEEDSTFNRSTDDESNSITLEQCLDLFTEPEILNPDEAWYCPKCKQHREATKQMSIWRLPHTVIIQLKRFSFRNFIWRDKIDKMVEFPTRGLNLSPYLIGKGHDGGPPPLYDLYAVVNHYGGILGGHYTSFVRCSDTIDPKKNEIDWRLCDDSRVSSIGHEKNAVSRGAYLLFYRCRTPFSPPPQIDLYDDEDEEGPSKEGSTLNDSSSEPKEDSTKDSDSLLYMGEDFPDMGDNSEKLTDDFGEMSQAQAGVKTFIKIESGHNKTLGLQVGSSIGLMDQASDNSSISDTEETHPQGYTDMEAVD
ncbi:ubiquitin carboxyl-terminal hydrolase 19-like [Mytilus galloprovincialis]|uniref:ubiquitin carboxyl-terminal hydrolase 19-like n=1 Tax=Mytilus galloprovincialis TaxID=29158 RepID=UPI003F7BBBDD